MLSTGIAQKKKAIITSKEPNLNVIYHPMYNDVQMVEVDVNSYQRSLHIQQYANRDLHVAYSRHS
ncbi:MAG: hypothetical protein V9E96_06295 [Chitinophagaceae bacterium]